MTKIAISPNVNGTGTFTLAAPDSNTNRTLTLPDAGGEVFSQGNIIGTVSESGGVPTGAIIQRGSNSNGEFVRFADGTMICSISNPLLDHTGQFSSSTRLFGRWTYPAEFVAPPHTSMDCGVDLGANFIGCNRLNVTNWGTNTGSTQLQERPFSIFFSSGVSTTNARVENVNLIAHGRWY